MSKPTRDEDAAISPMTVCTSLSNSCGEKSAATVRITDATLDERGALKCRLERSLDHLCERPTKRTRCSLHWWAGKCRKESDIVFCPTCNVHLCVDCYGPHFIEFLPWFQWKNSLSISIRKNGTSNSSRNHHKTSSWVEEVSSYTPKYSSKYHFIY